MTNVIDLPRRAIASAASAAARAATEPLRPLAQRNSVDDWGRDQNFVDVLSPLLAMRWNVSVGGIDHLPARVGALLVTNERHLSYSALYVSWALGRASGRPVRFVGRPDNAPFGPLLRRIGALLNDPIEVRGALRHGELVVVATRAVAHLRHAGAVDAELVGAAVAAGVGVYPVASMSNMFGRAARAEVGPAVRARRQRRGPLAEIELAEATQRHLQKMLDELGGLQTGVAPIDWLGEG